MNRYIKYLVNEIHSTVLATVDKDGCPVTCAVDMMDSDESGIYFLTARGKSLYRRLIDNPHIALTAMKGNDTIHTVAISLKGKVHEIGTERLPYLFHKNLYMKEIYPTEQSRASLTVFQIYEGNGEWFDLSKKPIEREEFFLGNISVIEKGYFIADKCIGCKQCTAVCPQNCIDFVDSHATIRQGNCLHCGNCFEVCPVNAVIRRD